MSCGEMWSKICPVETFLHMINVETIFFCHYSCWFIAKSGLLPFTLYWRKIYFVAIHALLCGDKFIQKLCLWRKKDKYQVWSWVIQNLNLKNWKCRGRKIYFKQSHLGNKKSHRTSPGAKILVVSRAIMKVL